MTTIRFGRLAAALLLMAVLTAGAVALSACGSGDDTAASSSPSAAAATGPITVTDDSGVEVTLEQPAEAIVSLAPANTEIAYAVGAGDKMVAGTSYDDYPEEAKALPKIGDFANPNVEKIASVLAGPGARSRRHPGQAAHQARDLGMTVYVVDPTDVRCRHRHHREHRQAGRHRGRGGDRDRWHGRRPDGGSGDRRRPAQGDDVP